MKGTTTLNLRKERLAELTAEDLHLVVGAISGLEECSLPTGTTRGCTDGCSILTCHCP